MSRNPDMEQSAFLEEIVARLKQVRGVSAIVLGGSRARGTHTPKSDFDLCLYYLPDQPLDLAALEQIAAQLDDQHRPGLVTPIGGWGPWINGGGWLTIQSQPVDFLYRDLQKVKSVIEDCHKGQVSIDYQPGHPHGFLSSVYMAEVALCGVLWESDGQVSGLKSLTSPYPAALKKALIDKFSWEINFSISLARKAIQRGDVAYAAGCCFRAVACMMQVLFALNQQYWMNEKGALALADSFPICPPGLREKIETAFGFLAANAVSIQKAVDLLDEVSQQVQALIVEK